MFGGNCLVRRWKIPKIRNILHILVLFVLQAVEQSLARNQLFRNQSLNGSYSDIVIIRQLIINHVETNL